MPPVSRRMLVPAFEVVVAVATVARCVATGSSYLDDKACFCGTTLRADDKLRSFMERPVETFKLSMPMLEFELLNANSTEQVQRWLYSLSVATDLHLETTAEDAIFVGFHDGRFVGFNRDLELRRRGPHEGAAADVLLNATAVHSTWSNLQCDRSEPREQVTTSVCPVSTEVDCTGCGVSVAALGPVVANASSCCDTNILATFSTDPLGRAVEWITWQLYDPRIRPWFTSASTSWQANQSDVLGWSPIYRFAGTQAVGLTTTRIIAVDGDLVGVIGIDYSLDHISRMLADSVTGVNGWAYLIERNGPNAGMLVGSTSVRDEGECPRGCIGEKLYTITSTRLRANMSQYSSIAESAQLLSRANWGESFVEKRASSATAGALFHECYLKARFDDCSLPIHNQYVHKSHVLGTMRAAGPRLCLDVPRESCVVEDADFGGNPTGFSAGGVPVACGYATVVAIGVSSAEFVPPSWYRDEIVVEPMLDSALACQRMCQRYDDCDFFSYIYRSFIGFEAKSMIHRGPNNAFDWLLVAGQDINCDRGFIYFEGNCVNCGSGMHPDVDGARCVSCPPRHATFTFSEDAENGTSTDGICERCPSGKLPNTVQSACVDCPAGLYDNQMVDRCEECPVGQSSKPGASSETGTSEGACQCAPTFYSSTGVSVSCYSAGYTTREISSDGEQCKKCGGLECVSSCEGEAVTIAEGWSAHPPVTHADGLIEVVIFACNPSAACAGGSVNISRQLLRQDRLFLGNCTAGHKGILCAECHDGWKMSLAGSCERCTTGGGWIVALFIPSAALAAYFFMRNFLWNRREEESTKQQSFDALFDSMLKQEERSEPEPEPEPEPESEPEVSPSPDRYLRTDNLRKSLSNFRPRYKLEARELLASMDLDHTGTVTQAEFKRWMQTDAKWEVILGMVAKIVIGLYQIIGEQLWHSISEQSSPSQELPDPQKESNSIFNVFLQFDIANLSPICEVTYVEQFFFKSLGLPLILLSLVYCVHLKLNQVKRNVSDLEEDQQKQKDKQWRQKCADYYFAFFLMCPTMSNTCLNHFICRQLPDREVLAGDYTMTCWEDWEWTVLAIWSAAWLAILIFVAPFCLCWQMYRDWKKHMEDHKGGEKSMADVYEDFGQKYYYVARHYRPTAWYAEFVDMIRRVFLSALITIPRGSVFYSMCSILFSTIFLVLHVRIWPYSFDFMNYLKLFADLQLVFATVLGLVRQIDETMLQREEFGRQFYGDVLFGLFLATPFSVLGALLYKKCSPTEQVRDVLHEEAKKLRAKAKAKTECYCSCTPGMNKGREQPTTEEREQPTTEEAVPSYEQEAETPQPEAEPEPEAEQAASQADAKHP